MKHQRFIVFDTETPNSRNDSICSIGITVIESGSIVAQRYDLVDPEAEFDAFNVRIHGILPQMVCGAKTFPELWKEIGPLLDSGILAAHNAAFDMGVLSKLFDRYHIEKRPDSYVCTVRLGRKCIPNAPNHRLDTLCRLLQIPLNHHNAASDSQAAAELLCYYMRHGLPQERDIKIWDYKKHTGRPGKKFDSSILSCTER